MASWRFKRGSWGCVDHLHALLAKFGKDLIWDFRFACPRWHLYTPESHRAHEILFVAQSSSSRGGHLSPR